MFLVFTALISYPYYQDSRNVGITLFFLPFTLMILILILCIKPKGIVMVKLIGLIQVMLIMHEGRTVKCT